MIGHMQNILLLDIENQPKKVRELNFLLKQYSQVILVYANSHLNIALDDLMELSLAIQDKRLLIIKMPKTGANSADFGLTFIAGRLSAQLDKGSSIDVMSNDAAMSYAVELLEQVGIQSAQLKQQLTEPKKMVEVAVTTIETKINPLQVTFVDDTIHKAVQLLLKNQPKKSKSLLKSLMSWCSLNQQQAEDMLLDLQKLQMVSIKQNKLEYHQKQMKKFLQVNGTKAVSDDDKMTMAYIKERPHLMHIKQYCDYLSKVNNNKPSKLETLSNSIKAALKFENQAQITHMLNLLKKYQIVQIQENKPVYLQNNIDLWAMLK